MGGKTMGIAWLWCAVNEMKGFFCQLGILRSGYLLHSVNWFSKTQGKNLRLADVKPVDVYPCAASLMEVCSWYVLPCSSMSTKKLL